LDPVTAAGLREHRSREQERFARLGRPWTATGYVFTSANGDPIDSRQDLREWKALLQAAEVRESRLHDARHTAASFLLLQGVDPRVVMDLMGWSTVTMLRRYQHVVDSLRRDAAHRVGDLLYGTIDGVPTQNGKSG
jgi:integrase